MRSLPVGSDAYSHPQVPRLTDLLPGTLVVQVQIWALPDTASGSLPPRALLLALDMDYHMLARACT